MIPARRFAFGLVILAIAVGVIRGVIVGWVYHLPGVFALRLGAGQVALSSFWIPVGLVALSVLESRLSPLARAVAIVIVGAAALAIEPALIPILGAQGLHPPPYWIRFLNRADTSELPRNSQG